MRLNFSHATPEEFFLRVNNLAASEGGDYVAKLLDTRPSSNKTWSPTFTFAGIFS